MRPNIPTMVGLLNCGNPVLHKWAASAAQWSLERKLIALSTAAFAHGYLQYEPWAGAFPFSAGRDQEKLLREHRQALENAAEKAVLDEPKLQQAAQRSDLLLDPDIEEVWRAHCNLWPYAELDDYPLECFSFLRSLVEADGSRFAGILNSVIPSEAEVLRRLPILDKETAVQLCALPDRFRPWWRREQHRKRPLP